MTRQTHTEPVASRPTLPEGYGIPHSREGMLPWSHVGTLMEGALNYWVGTVRPDRRPHAVPIWGAWLADTFYFEGSPETRRGRNISANPAVVVHIERGDDVVIIEGDAEEIKQPDPALAQRIAAAFSAKYQPAFNYAPTPESWNEGGLYRVHPRRVLAWNSFPTTATRWTFEQA